MAVLVPNPFLFLLENHFLIVTLALGGRSGADVFANGAPISSSKTFNGLVEQSRFLFGPLSRCRQGALLVTTGVAFFLFRNHLWTLGITLGA